MPGDEDQLQQVFTNLLENAIKYGAAGGRIRVALTAGEREPRLRGPVARVDVIDWGEGFDPIHIPRLTERFYRIDSHRAREMGGTGLGLAIVKHIVNRHRGAPQDRERAGAGEPLFGDPARRVREPWRPAHVTKGLPRCHKT